MGDNVLISNRCDNYEGSDIEEDVAFEFLSLECVWVVVSIPNLGCLRLKCSLLG